MQETWVRSPIQEDSTWCGATKPVCHDYWACSLEPRSHNYWPHMLQPLKLALPRALNKRSHCSSRVALLASTREQPVQQWRPSTVKDKYTNKILRKKESLDFEWSSVWGGRREEGSGWGTHVYPWRIHFSVWQNHYNIVKLKNKIKLKKMFVNKWVN